MINRIILLLFIPFIFVLITCSNDSADQQKDLAEIEIPEYFGTYLYNDDDCGGSDIQYATVSENGITFFDYLGDGCDDTVSCYTQDFYEITEITADTFLIVSQDGSYITDGELYLNADSSITLSYEGNYGPVEYSWNKLKDDIYTFTPLCDQEYENTKDIADMMVYAVSDNGDLLWKNYIHVGIWDLGTSVTQLSDGGYMVFGAFDVIEWGGCCYTPNGKVRDIIKLNSLGQELWRKKINIYDDTYGSSFIGKSLIETSNGDLVFIAGALSELRITVAMIDSVGNLIWKQNYSNVGYYNYNAELLETEYGDLAIIAGGDPRRSYGNPADFPQRLTFRLLDYYSGAIIEEKLYDELGYARAIVNVEDDFAILGNARIGEFANPLDPIFLLKINSEGDEIWRKIWSDDSLKPNTALDLIFTSDNGYLLFCESDPAPYAMLIKTDSEGNEEWRKKYDDFVGGSQGWIHETEDGGYFMASGYAVTKLDANGEVEWNAAGPSSFTKFFNNGVVSGINYDMKKISNGAVMTGYGSASWE